MTSFSSQLSSICVPLAPCMFAFVCYVNETPRFSYAFLFFLHQSHNTGIVPCSEKKHNSYSHGLNLGAGLLDFKQEPCHTMSLLQETPPACLPSFREVQVWIVISQVVSCYHMVITLSYLYKDQYRTQFSYWNQSTAVYDSVILWATRRKLIPPQPRRGHPYITFSQSSYCD